MEIEIDPKRKLAKLAKLLKEEAPKQMNRQLSKAVGNVVAPLKREVTTNVHNFLPRSGGLAKRVSRSRLRHRMTRGSRDPKVTIGVERDPQILRDPLRVDRGRLAHPVFGMAHSRNPWVLQDAPQPGWFTEPLTDSAPIVQRELVEVIDEFTERIEKRI